MPILVALKNLKYLVKPILIISLIVGVGYFGKQYHSYVYNQGFNSAVQSYNEQVIEVREQERDLYEKAISKFKNEIQAQHQQDLKRVESEKIIDKKVEYVTKIIKEKEYVQAQCNTVHPDIVSMFNETISSINR